MRSHTIVLDIRRKKGARNKGIREVERKRGKRKREMREGIGIFFIYLFILRYGDYYKLGSTRYAVTASGGGSVSEKWSVVTLEFNSNL